MAGEGSLEGSLVFVGGAGERAEQFLGGFQASQCGGEFWGTDHFVFVLVCFDPSGSRAERVGRSHVDPLSLDADPVESSFGVGGREQVEDFQFATWARCKVRGNAAGLPIEHIGSGDGPSWRMLLGLLDEGQDAVLIIESRSAVGPDIWDVVEDAYAASFRGGEETVGEGGVEKEVIS